jgi:hypothetical protein
MRVPFYLAGMLGQRRTLLLSIIRRAGDARNEKGEFSIKGPAKTPRRRSAIGRLTVSAAVPAAAESGFIRHNRGVLGT